MPGTPTPPTSPYVFSAIDYKDLALTITVNFNNSTGAITNGTVVRDPGCVYQHVYLGVGPDGTPDTSPNVFTVPSGTLNISAKQFAANGFNTISDITAQQITAGP